MAVFSGGRTLDAIEAVCDAGGDLPLDAFEGVSSLLDKSLLRQEEGPEGEPQCVMLETFHEYARERPQDSGEAEEIGRAHIRCFLALAEEAAPELTGADHVSWTWSRRCGSGAPCGASGTSGATLARAGTGWEQVCQGEGPPLSASGARRRLVWGTWS